MPKTMPRHSELKKANYKYINSVDLAGEKHVSFFRRLKFRSERARHLDELKKDDFFSRILNKRKQKKITVSLNDKKHSFTVLGVGFDSPEITRPIVVALDEFGRSLFFYKSTGINSNLPNKWLPFHKLEYRIAEDGKSHLWYQKYFTHPEFPEKLVRLGEEIENLEDQIEFTDQATVAQINSIRELL